MGIPKEEWSRALRAFSDRNAGRHTSLEVDDPELGAQVQQRDYQLRGVSYDPRDDRIEIMLGGFEGIGPHLTHAIYEPSGVDVVADESGRDTVLRISEDGTQTLLRIER